jgi:NAD(P)-dependent dehydrogenase (short-subunit alcohol dehydrogenase family)
VDNPFAVRGKHILITGASSGIGAQAALECAQLGAHVTLTGRNEERLNEVFSQLKGEGHQRFVGDLTDECVREKLIDCLPVLDGVVYSSGVSLLRPLKFIKQKDLDAVVKINLDTPILLSALLVKHKKVNNGASIVFVNSISSLVGTTGHLAYAVSKSGLLGAVRVMALELAPQGVRVNCISPGIVRTPLIDELEASVSKEKMAEREALHPLGFGTVQDVAYSLVYLLSDAARWVTGSNLVIDGGYTVH